ncbi:AAA family ATPase [Thiothrix subterranea]|uniref:AAA family ATPase n=1 Tax=Thiothrix subterranea TaxID=2735563 RepID=A0AA51MPF6_9GAMM|nr:AAA family ATPase [Thiothrix subterranea]MDQ5770530.1 AAA family ATPase [Thiothrix subterranea]WML87464.1 AAA family ATPase [Thiothrix subterranea]
MLDLTHLRLDDVQGVGTITLDLEPGKQAYVFIGANGVGKTKLLEALFNKIKIQHVKSLKDIFDLDQIQTTFPRYELITTNDRGHFTRSSKKQDELRTWIIESASLSSVFQRSKNNRERQLKTLLKCLNDIDPSYDKNFLEVDEKGNIFLLINQKEKELSELSTGFVSIFKILTEIISRYGQESNDIEIQNVEGIFLIDEIESHLHLEWQVKIIPTLKKLFPNTTFFIATHSPLVLSQLEDGEAYELRRDADDIVRTYKIKNPGNTAMIDLLKQAFHIDLNRLALDRPVSNAQKEAKKKLLKYLRERKAS